MPPIRIPIRSRWLRSDGHGRKISVVAALGNAAQITSALVAIFGFGAVLLQLNEIRSNNRAASARQVYLAYMDLEFRNPQLAVPDYSKIRAGDRDTRLRYESFVS